MAPEGRPTSSQRGYGSLWRKRRAEHLERVKKRQEAEGWPGGPWCECSLCEEIRDKPAVLQGIINETAKQSPGHPVPQLSERADTVDHIRPRRLFPLELQGSDAPGGSDHPSNLRAMSWGHHSRRKDDKSRRRV